MFQYSFEGNYIATHYAEQMRFATGMNPAMIRIAIEKNKGFIYDFQWSITKYTPMRNLNQIDPQELEQLKHFVKFRKVENVTWIPGKEIYDRRIQEVDSPRSAGFVIPQ